MTVAVCALGLVGAAGVPDASAAYVGGQSACKVIDTSNKDASRAAQNAETIYDGQSLQVKRLDNKRRWEIRVLTGSKVVRVWTDYQGQITDPHYGTSSATPEQRATMQRSSISIKKAVSKFSPPDSVLRSAQLVGEDDNGVIILEFDDLNCQPLRTVMVDAATGVVLAD